MAEFKQANAGDLQLRALWTQRRLAVEILRCPFSLFLVCSSQSTGINATFREREHSPHGISKADGKYPGPE